MTRASAFNWSLLDRDVVAEMVGYTAPTIVNKSLSPLQVADKVRTLFRFFEIPLNVRCSYSKKTDKNAAWVGGLYDSVADKKNKQAITVVMQFNTRHSNVKLSEINLKRMSFRIADTIMHEVIHMRQYRRRSYKDIPGYQSTAHRGIQRKQQIYLGHDDEIDAYAFNTACQLMDRFARDKQKIVNYLNSDLYDQRRKKDVYRMYLHTFDYDHGHRVIRKLKKKVINYLPNALELGKPYKTTDWLKK
jgi:hypothetical protein